MCVIASYDDIADRSWHDTGSGRLPISKVVARTEGDLGITGNCSYYLQKGLNLRRTSRRTQTQAKSPRSFVSASSRYCSVADMRRTMACWSLTNVLIRPDSMMVAKGKTLRCWRGTMNGLKYDRIAPISQNGLLSVCLSRLD